METDEKLAIPEAPEHEVGIAFNGPAPFANRILITGSDEIVRIAFLEQEPASSQVHFRSAATLTLRDAIALRDTIDRLFNDVAGHVRERE